MVQESSLMPAPSTATEDPEPTHRFRLLHAFEPRPTLSESEIHSGLRFLTFEGTASMGFGSITGSGFLAAFALILGANNLQIGILAALPFATMPLQVVTVSFIEHVGHRKLISTSLWLCAQAIWIPIALIPVLLSVPSAGAVSLLLAFIAARSLFVAMQNAAWNSWLRDLVPQNVLGSFFAQRLMYANIAAMIFGLGAAVFVDFWKGRTAGADQAYGYTFAILTGVLFLGLASPVFRSFIPEPLQQPPERGQQSLIAGLVEPFKDREFRPLIRFLFMWNLALNLATPFFAVYMLQRLHLSLTAVMAFTVLSTAFNAMFLRVWGPLADRVGNKPVLSVSASLYLLVILGWTFTTMPERYFLTIPLLFMLQILSGIASAGVSFTTGTLGMKIAPRGKATSYIAATSVAANLGAAIGPLLGGRFADFFAVRSLALNIQWTDPHGVISLPALNLSGFDFLFSLTFVIGIFTLNNLATLRETGEASREVVLDALLAPMRRVTQPMSTVPGLGFLTQFPYAYARRVPGVDVALGVTAYQIAEAARVAVASAGHGRRTTDRIVDSIDEILQNVRRAGGQADVTAPIARHTARGIMHAPVNAAGDVARLSRRAMIGVARAFRVQPRANREALLRSSAYGIVQGAIEAKRDPVEAAVAAVAAAMQISGQYRLTRQSARRFAAAGAIQAAEDLASEEEAEAVRRALVEFDASSIAEEGSFADDREDLAAPNGSNRTEDPS